MRQSVETKHWVIHNDVDNPVDKWVSHPHIQQAATHITNDELVAFPTETVYGLGANALSDKASHKIFEAKGRPADNPLIVHVAAIAEVDNVVDNFTEQARLLMAAFWPGPLTLILPSNGNACQTVTAGLSTVAVRMPDHPLALALIRAAGKPLAAPSANRSGKPSPTSAAHVLHDLQGRIAGVLDGGRTGVGVESTVVDVTGEKPLILRPGGITRQDLQEVVGNVDVDPALLDGVREQPRSPGVKYAHYAPEGDMWLVSMEKGIEGMQHTLWEHVLQDLRAGKKVGILTTDEGKDLYAHCWQKLKGYEGAKEVQDGQLVVASVGLRADAEQVAHNIYDVLRHFDESQVQSIYAETFSRDGVGEAVMNRLMKAANQKVIHV